MKEKIPRQPMPEQPPAERVRNFKEVPWATPTRPRGSRRHAASVQASTCVEGCPVRIDIPASSKRSAPVSSWIHPRYKNDKFPPAVCGRVCPQEEQCEKLCVLTKKGESVRHREARALCRRLRARA
jgi:glutamate synthase (NADPH/NADH) small chain